MKIPFHPRWLLPLLFLAAPLAAQTAAPAPTVVPAAALGQRLVFPFESAWDFHKYAAGENTAPADLTWRTLNLPHDWSNEGPYEQNAPATGSGGWVPTGTAVYRKTFVLSPDDLGKHVEIQFDGIMANGEVFINGHGFGVRPYGYVSVHYDLTPYLTYGANQPNTIYVNVNNGIQPASRYYTGSGIERHVRLVVSDPVHVQTWGLYVTTPQITPQMATVHLETTVTNDSSKPGSFFIQSMVHDSDGHMVGPSYKSAPQTIAAGQSATFEQDIPVANPKLWDLDSPNLYKALVAVVNNNAPGPGGTGMMDTRTVDVDSATFGIRKIEFKPETGFWLNGKNIKLLGVCVHEDGGAVGEAVPRSVYVERFSAMKALGANAIRLAHNPPNPVELDVCDQLGLLVMDEMFDCWTVAKPGATQGYNLFFTDWSLKDLHDAVMRDRNHPSIILWSAGNEIHDTPQEEKAKGILQGLVAEFHKVNPPGLVTQALFRPNTSHDYTNGLADMLDVIGTNYRHDELEADLEAGPNRTGVITEENQDAASWIYDRDHPRISGLFLWAGIDYLGEAGAWPNIGSGAGLVDRTLLPKANGLQRDSWWDTKPVVHIVRNSDRGGGGRRGGAGGAGGVADWTPQNPATYTQATVTVYSNCDSVELFLNGQSLGAKPMPADKAAPRVWNVAYAPGTLRAVGSNEGKTAATDELQTAGPAAKVVLTADTTKAEPDFDDVVFVRAMITDSQGVRVPYAETPITFTASGPGVIVATDSGSNTDHTVFSSPTRDVRDGNCLALVRATAANGKIVVTASVDGLQPGTLTLDAAPVQPAN